jgi:hypothetical protein
VGSHRSVYTGIFAPGTVRILKGAAGDLAGGDLALGIWTVPSQRGATLSHGSCALCWLAWQFTRPTAICVMESSWSPLPRCNSLLPTISCLLRRTRVMASAGAAAFMDFRMQVQFWLRQIK